MEDLIIIGSIILFGILSIGYFVLILYLRNENKRKNNIIYFKKGGRINDKFNKRY